MSNNGYNNWLGTACRAVLSPCVCVCVCVCMSVFVSFVCAKVSACLLSYMKPACIQPVVSSHSCWSKPACMFIMYLFGCCFFHASIDSWSMPINDPRLPHHSTNDQWGRESGLRELNQQLCRGPDSFSVMLLQQNLPPPHHTHTHTHIMANHPTFDLRLLPLSALMPVIFLIKFVFTPAER